MRTKILIVEHDLLEIELIRQELKKDNVNYIAEIVQTEEDYENALRNFKPDIILSAYTFPSFSGSAAFNIKEQLTPQTPFIFVSESIGEENAIEFIKKGVTDFVLKESIFNLSTKVNRALKEAATKKGLIDVKKIMDYSLDVICTSDKEGRFVHMSAASESLWGYKPEELIGKKYMDLVFQKDVDNTINASFDIISGKPKTVFENRYIHKNGTLVPTSWSAVWDEKDKLMYSIAKDPTDKKRLEKALAFENQRFKNLFAHAPSCMGVLKGPNHIYEIVNNAYLNLTFKKKKDLIGKTVKELLPELESHDIIKFLDTVYKTGKTFSAKEMLFQLKNRNGEFFDMYFNLIFQANRNIDGKIDGVFFSLINVTEQVSSREKVEESEKKYKYLFDHNPMPMWIIDLITFKFLDVNEIALLNYGYSREEFLSMTALDIRPEEDHESFRQTINFEYKPNYSRGIARHRKKDGTIISVEITGHDITFGESPARFILSKDITERKEAEEKLSQSESRLKEAQSIAHLGNWELNFETGIALWSDESCRIYGVSPEDNKQSYASWLSFIHPDDLDYVMKIINESQIALSNSVLHNRIILKDGTIKHIESESRFEFDKNGKPVGLFGVAHDVTAMKLAKLQLEQQNKELFKTNEELDRLVYSMSHDLRSPLTSILGIVSLIEYESEEPNTIKHVKMIRDSINRLDIFIKNILSYSQNKRGSMEVNKIPIQKTINEIVHSLRSIKEAKGIDFEVNIEEMQPFYSDWQRFNTVLENLISNAIKYHTKEVSGKYIKVIGTADKEKLQLRIVDNGIGISSTYHTKIFDMFFRISGEVPGSGVGLYIVKETVDKLQGSINVQSEKGTGTIFTIMLKNLKP